MSDRPTRLYAIGQTYGDFQVTKAIAIPELHCFLRELVHLPTGAQVMNLVNDDPENLFCLSFRTLPDNSNGVAHILEHTVLCGSQKFPMKDPFFAMTRRSLNTFMNAFTGSDFTCYPAASQVKKDFYNLLEVYLDAVFHPNLKELSFLQEGHRLEFTDPKDPTSPLQYRGIVFNEMKGAMSSPNERLAEVMNRALFPDLTYGYNSGGDPKEIPQLTYPELCAFYQNFYHPSRCVFFFYGNMPLEGHLDFIAKNALENVKKREPIPQLPPQTRFKEPRRLMVDYPIAAEEDLKDKAIIAFGWLTCHILEQQELLALNILEIVLMDTDASPLKLAFLKSGLCKQATVYMDMDISEVPLGITLKGCNPESADALESLLRQTLEDLIKDGISLESIENAMHQVEFFRSEIGGNHVPFGLSLFMRSALLKQHGGNPEDGLTIHTLCDRIRRSYLEDPHYYSKLIRKYLLDNPHFVRVVMMPNKELAEIESKEEANLLEKIRKSLSAEQTKQIVQRAAELEVFQKRQEEEIDPDILPKITLDDVPKASKEYELTQERVGNLEVFYHSCFTNEIVYTDLIFDLAQVTEQELPFVRMLTSFMPQMGCGGRKYTETLDYIQAHTGGISAYLTLNPQASDPSKLFPALTIRGKALHRKSAKLFTLLNEMVDSIDFTDIERLKELILKQYTSLNGSLQQSAMKYAMSLSASGLDLASKISNSWYGLEYYWTIKKLAENIDKEVVPLSRMLQSLQRRLLGVENPHLILTCDASMYDELKNRRFDGLSEIKTRSSTPWKGQYPLAAVPDQGRVITSPIAFTSHVFQTVPYAHSDAPALSVAAGLFENLVLHPVVREQGGAYGGGASNNALLGNFYFYAYRDPNISRTLYAFDEAVETILKGNFEDSDLEEAKLEVIQDLDAPLAPGSRGELAYSWRREGKTPEVRQAFRNRLLSLTRDDVIKAVKKHISGRTHKGVIVVFAGRELLEKENALLIAQGKPPFPIEQI